MYTISQIAGVLPTYLLWFPLPSDVHYKWSLSQRHALSNNDIIAIFDVSKKSRLLSAWFTVVKTTEGGLASIISDPYLSECSLYSTDVVVLSDLIYPIKEVYGLHGFPVVNATCNNGFTL